ncbi:TrkH family potassium uptake protein [Amphritea opalescens]|uniref:Trk system potassium uptake protein n=1 Tax=Amphritea opalescens TaxID=2490544 RepID=A0A430KW85_9GAMM|nr:TrkH family potassium uptake protein [Amphritea opalescens]RTE67738.1 TrkH family potassium uptake protein [Amphritea opalescens]
MIKLFRPVLYVCGILTWIMAGLMLIPAGYGFIYDDPEFIPFLASAGLSMVLGIILVILFKAPRFTLTSRQLYLLTSCSWMLVSFLGALPLMLCHHPLSLTDAVFESVSGITTTGSTVISGLQTLPSSLLLWRSLLQWLGGLGVIGMAVTVLPFLRIGGMRLFRTESSDWAEKSLPRFNELARSLLFSYLLITCCCAASYWFAGMTPFDAINHAFTTVSTGGYATDDRSMGRFGPTILWIAVFFMLLGALPFTLFIRFLLKPSLKSLADQQVKGFLMIVAGLVIVLTTQRLLTSDTPFFAALTHTAFNLTSVITTTGYASADYTLWGQFSIALFFIVTFIGGCSGSTAGGMKVFRFQLAFLFLQDQFRKLVHPRGVFSIHYNGKLVHDDIIVSAVAFSFIFFLTLAVATLMLTAIGIDFVTSISGAATALTNVGPGLGSTIGPAGNFAPLPDLAKWVLAFTMILGRLELLTVVVLFSPTFWKG